MKLNSTTHTSEMKKLRSRAFALLARVGHQKRKALAYQEEAEHYSLIATEALAGLGEVLEFLQGVATRTPELQEFVSDHTSRQHALIQQLLSFWPRNSDSQERALSLLDSDGLVNLLEDTQDGYVSLSTGLILENVARAIEATKGPIPKP